MGIRRISTKYVWALAALMLSGTLQAAEVNLPYAGRVLNANLELVPGKQLADGVILITHGGLAHKGMELIAGFQAALKKKGYNTLAINLSLGIDNRHGMYDCGVIHRHRNQDAADEIGAWVDWLTIHNAGPIVLLGHSRGGAQTALYANGNGHGHYRAVILMAPAIRENTDAATYQKRFQQPLAPILEKAQTLVKTGRGKTVLEHVGLLTCNDTSATAESFLSYYAPDAQVDTPSLLPGIRKPTLVLVGGSDEVVVGLDGKLSSLSGLSQLQVKVIDGADHVFMDLYTLDAVDVIDDFLKRRVHLSSCPGSGNVCLLK